MPHSTDPDAYVEVDVGVGVTLWRAYARGCCCIAKGLVGSKPGDLDALPAVVERAFKLAKRTRGWT